MTVVWLIVWLIENTPPLDFTGSFLSDWNNWAIALIICIFLDVVGTSRVL